MEKAKFKKNIHFTNEEEIFVAKMISDGAEFCIKRYVFFTEIKFYF